jgi:6-phosphogluconolactonase (cycloisomerase 2 family)
VSPDGRHVYVAGQLDNAIAIFARDPLTGALTFVEAKR